MDKFEIYKQALKERYRDITVDEQVPMKEHTSFRIGGPARLMVTPQTPEQTALAMKTAKEMQLDTLILGKGTNLLVTDKPLDKVVIRLYDGLDNMDFSGENMIYAESGAPLSRIAVFAMNSSLSGFEFAHGIPGTLGGAVAMNAGAYGGEMKDVIVSTTYLDDACEIRTIRGNEHKFSYRSSFFADTDYLILSSEIRLEPGNPLLIMKKIKELSDKRKASQPLDMPSAGSTFKRPVTGYAASLIDQSGLKGKGVGSACVSEKHAGFIVNKGNATFEDVLSTMALVQKTVYEKFGAILEPEVKIIK